MTSCISIVIRVYKPFVPIVVPWIMTPGIYSSEDGSEVFTYVVTPCGIAKLKLAKTFVGLNFRHIGKISSLGVDTVFTDMVC